MDLSFEEKSAWGLLIGIGAVSYFYFPAAFDVASRVSHGAPLVGLSIAGVVALVIIEATYHAVIAVSGDTSRDERDILFNLKSERNAGYVLGIGLFVLVGHIIATHSMDDRAPVGALAIAVWVLFALTLSEAAKLISQICYYRFGG